MVKNIYLTNNEIETNILSISELNEKNSGEGIVYNNSLYCRISNSFLQNVIQSIPVAITFDTDDSDIFNMHSTSLNTSRITVPRAGKFFVQYQTYIESTVEGNMEAWIAVNGGISTTNIRYAPIKVYKGAGHESYTGSAIINLSENDYVEIYVLHDLVTPKGFGGTTANRLNRMYLYEIL